MINVAVCDDNDCIVEMLVQKIRNHYIQKGIEVIVDGYTSGGALLEKVRNYDCTFLDIDMPEINGYEVAEEIRKISSDCCIIMATAQAMDYKPAFVLGAFRFITKPFRDEEIAEALDKLAEMKKPDGTISAYHKRIKFNVPLKRVEYIRAINSEVEIVTKDQVYRRDASLKDIECEISSDSFYRCHRSYLINLDNARICKNHIVVGEKVIPVSRRNIKATEDRIINYSLSHK